MPGNETQTAEYLIRNLNNNIILGNLGEVVNIGFPKNDGTIQNVESLNQLNQLDSNDSDKKADFYINDFGISAKQEGSHFDFNRLRRTDLPRFFNALEIGEDYIVILDQLIADFHNGKLDRNNSRDRKWQEVFNDSDFIKMLHYLMMIGSPVKGDSQHIAEYILETPRRFDNHDAFVVSTFEEYFNRNAENIFLSLRRSWFGQNSRTEHGRAKGIINNTGNEQWVFDTVSGQPRSGWNQDINEADRKTAYYIMLTKG